MRHLFLQRLLIVGALMFGLSFGAADASQIQTFKTGGVVTQGQRLTLSTTTVIAAGTGDEDIGTAHAPAASGALVGVVMTSDGEIGDYIASGAITAGADVYPAAAGLVSATVTGKRIGKAINTTTTSGDAIKVLKLCLPTSPTPPNVTITTNIAAATVSEFVFICDRAYTVVSIKEVHSVVSSSGTCAVRKITGTHLAGAAVGSGVVELLSTTTGFDLTTTAGATVTGTLSSTSTDYDLASGDKIAFNIAGTMTGLVGGNVTIVLQPK